MCEGEGRTIMRPSASDKGGNRYRRRGGGKSGECDKDPGEDGVLGRKGSREEHVTGGSGGDNG